MFDRYYRIKTFCDARKLDDLKENALENSYIRRLNFRGIGTFTACVFITPIPGHKQRDVWRHGFRFATLHVFSLTSDFRTAQECVLRKPRNRFTTARQFPCQNMDFRPLIPSDTAFYAIITYKILSGLFPCMYHAVHPWTWLTRSCFDKNTRSKRRVIC